MTSAADDAVQSMEDAARAAAAAAAQIAPLPTERKNAVLHALAARLEQDRNPILEANRRDLDAARELGLTSAKLRRLELTPASIEQMAAGIRRVAELPDPVGEVTRDYRVDSGLHVRKVRIPIGVIAMIYEARPNVTADAFALCFKAGNACLLKGGREAACSNAALAERIHAVLSAAQLPVGALAALTAAGRDDIRALLQLDQYIDLVIPRGGAELIRFVHEHSRIPTIQHFQGVCHIFVDDSARLDEALEICTTAKTSAPATCNAVETILVHEGIAEHFVPLLARRYADLGVEVRGDARVCALAGSSRTAAAEDWGREFLDLIVAVRVVSGVDEAIAHIGRYGSSHTEAILSETPEHQARFIAQVRSSCVLVNASTRFNDGFQLGLGAEIGISTSRIHAYGPMGLEALTIERFVVHGTGQCR